VKTKRKRRFRNDTEDKDKKISKHKPVRSIIKGLDGSALQRAMADSALRSADISSLQRTIGNQAVQRILAAPTTSIIQQRLTEKQQRQVDSDISAVEGAMGRMNWSGNFGPSVRVETPLRWENEQCRKLYLTLKQKYDDQIISGSSRPKLYYYFGAIGNWGKAGFRISGHTKQRADLRGGKNVRTEGVLHVENS
jgi:hypothetical protein